MVSVSKYLKDTAFDVSVSWIHFKSIFPNPGPIVTSSDNKCVFGSAQWTERWPRPPAIRRREAEAAAVPGCRPPRRR